MTPHITSRPVLALGTALLAAAVVVSGCSAPGPPGPGQGASASVAAPPSSPTSVTPPSTLAPPTVPASTAPRSSTPPPSTSTPISAAGCPRDLPSTLESTGPGRQLITVEAAGYDTSNATVEAWQRSGSGSCWDQVGGPWNALIGQNGFSDRHIEGDGTTPTGIYPVGSTIFGNDPNPGVKATYHQLVCGDWWDEDPHSPSYNTFQHVQCGQTPRFAAGSEALWKETDPYPSFAVIEYNTHPAVPYAGSGIFLHAYVGVPTTGCVSIPLADLDQVLRWLDPAADPAVVMGPASEIRNF